jgi:hypothetical protein
MGLTVRPYLAIINLSVATGFRTPILFGRLPTGSLYSLEKLIEWKQYPNQEFLNNPFALSTR